MSTLLACPGTSLLPSYSYGWKGEPARPGPLDQLSNVLESCAMK